MARTHYSVDDCTAFDAYCSRHGVDRDAAMTELVEMALGLPVEILDYLRGQRRADSAAA